MAGRVEAVVIELEYVLLSKDSGDLLRGDRLEDGNGLRPGQGLRLPVAGESAHVNSLAMK